MAQTPTHATHQSHPEPNYLAVIIVLTVLTVAEIALTFAPIPKLAIGILLVGLALTKAIIVAMFFMHLKFEKTTLALIAATPLILCTMLLFALLPDSNPAHNKGGTRAAQPTEQAPPTPAH
jgi:cytochrome c oxidase subunit IV